MNKGTVEGQWGSQQRRRGKGSEESQEGQLLHWGELQTYRHALTLLSWWTYWKNNFLVKTYTYVGFLALGSLR